MRFQHKIGSDLKQHAQDQGKPLNETIKSHWRHLIGSLVVQYG